MRPVIVVPYRGTNTARMHNFAAVTRQLDVIYERMGIPWIHGDAGGDPFSIAHTWNALAQSVTGLWPEWTHIIRWAADFLIDTPRSITTALEQTDWDQHPHVLPFTTVTKLTQKETERYWDRSVLPEIRHDRVPYGGINITTRAAWDHLGGFNEAFTGWGHEDREYVHRLQNTYGPRHRTTGHMWILWHPRHTNDPYWNTRTHNHQLLTELTKEEQ